MTCKQLQEKLQQLNPTLKLEVKKVTECGRITGKCITYQLRVEGTKFYIGAFTLDDVITKYHEEREKYTDAEIEAVINEVYYKV